MDRPEVCTRDGCEKPVRCRGLCGMHYERERSAGRLGNGPCSVEGCDRPTKAKGLCRAHYDHQRLSDPSRPSCAEEGCTAPLFCQGLCSRHYHRARLAGEYGVGAPCSVEGCERIGSSRGYCQPHYTEARRNGAFEDVPECLADGCNALAVAARGYCTQCYGKARRAGELKGEACSVPGCVKYASTGPFCGRHYYRHNKYGLSPEEMGRLDDGVGCEICGDPATDVDHCHKRGHVRGYLCNSCNVSLGSMRDSPELLRVAAKYLERAG